MWCFVPPTEPAKVDAELVQRQNPRAASELVSYRIEEQVRAFITHASMTLARTTTAFRLSPAIFARFIGDFRNAALNAA